MPIPALARRLFALLLCSSSLLPLMAQVCLHEDEPISPPSLLGGGSNLYETRHGRYLPTRGTLRVLVVLVEVDYQVPGEPDPTGPNGTAGWPAHQLPVWVDNVDPSENLFDSQVLPAPQGSVTQYYYQASSGAFSVIADYLMAPSNNGVFSVPSSTGYFPSLYPVVSAVNTALNGNFDTYYQHGINDFDNFVINGSATEGLEKAHPSNENPAKYDHICFIFRNSRNYKGGVYVEMDQTGSTNWGSPGSMSGHDSNTWSRLAAYSKRPTSIFRHEFGHNLYGGNNFHYAGGGDGTSGMYWISYSGGWGNMGLHNCSIESWSAWDRLQMDWKNVGQVNLVAARDPANANEANGDLDATVPAQAGTYVLRDFVQTGDAIRIKLPFTDPVNEYPEFLWVENHQGIGLNGNPFDKWLHESSGAPCVIDMVPGLQMYVQIDKETRQSSSLHDLYLGPGDYLRPLDANGHVDESINSGTQNMFCVCYGCPKYPFVRGLANPFTGSADRHFVSHNLNPASAAR